MKEVLSIFMGLIMALQYSITSAQSEPASTSNIDPENVLVMQLKDGPVHIQLFPEQAPLTVQRIKELTREGFYNGVVFHRVIDGFMAQTGDPTGTGTGSSSKPNLKAEFNDIKHERGTVSMARASDINSANSQFFIMFAAAPHLDKQYTAFGKVISGMEFVDLIKKGNPGRNGAVDLPDKLLLMQVLADINKDKDAKPVTTTETNSANVQVPTNSDNPATTNPDTSINKEVQQSNPQATTDSQPQTTTPNTQ